MKPVTNATPLREFPVHLWSDCDLIGKIMTWMREALVMASRVNSNSRFGRDQPENALFLRRFRGAG